MVSSRETLVKSESMPKLTMKLLQSSSTISVAKLNKHLTVYLLVINCSRIAPKNFTNLYIGVCKTDKIVPKIEQPSTHFYAL